jgi:CheY-like chemotaxis protein
MKRKKSDRGAEGTTSLGIGASGLDALLRAMPDDTRDGRWYSLHVRPFDGAVMMMPDDLPDGSDVADQRVVEDLRDDSLNELTERDRLEEELRERTEELNAANRSKAEFIAVLSHELRTPLNAISGWAELLKNPALSEDDRLKGAEIIARNVKAQAQLITDFLDVHQIATEKPGAAPSAPPVTVAEREAGDAPDSLRGLKVLVVDDDAEAHEPIRRVLEDYGAEVVAVRSATAALDAIPQHLPDVIVSDIGMPGRDGYDLIRAIRALPRHRGGAIPAIALTGFGTAEERARALNAGYMNHFAKPIEATVLVAVVAGLGARRLRSAAAEAGREVGDSG